MLNSPLRSLQSVDGLEALGKAEVVILRLRGLDESIHVQLRVLASNELLGHNINDELVSLARVKLVLSVDESQLDIASVNIVLLDGLERLGESVGLEGSLTGEAGKLGGRDQILDEAILFFNAESIIGGHELVVKLDGLPKFLLVLHGLLGLDTIGVSLLLEHLGEVQLLNRLGLFGIKLGRIVLVHGQLLGGISETTGSLELSENVELVLVVLNGLGRCEEESDGGVFHFLIILLYER